MTTAPFHDRNASYGDRAVDEPRTERSVAEHIFIWVAWALAAAFWGASITMITGILSEVAKPAPAPAGIAVGGMGWAMDVLGVLLVIGLAVAWGVWATRGRDLSPAAVRARREFQ